ncbi:MFS transporter [Rubripirellula amarantea]|uniref:Putative nucleoside transporter YegT n=1 Tax=Rubripirellula amarantea TaxID=2527999 RepID=A0A5C5WQW4_9BACT|nr:MFS transporter [Rubripirellula amarantea]MDA8743628.1 MFS transporter [Rubripirellula amarantea]TWT52423.1 putative nucleoside transporter YegT [Rubripirellula amarantea]
MSISIRLKIMMFLQFFVWGVFFVTMGGYLTNIFASYEEEGKLNQIIGSTYATQTWAALLAPLIVGFVADRLMNKEQINGILHLIGAGVLYWVSTITDSPSQFFFAMLAFFICYMPTLALVNTITFQNVESTERDFPRIRLWGTIGWIVAGLVVSQSFFGIFPFKVLPGVADAGGTAVQFQIAALVSFIYGIYSFTLPKSPPEGKGKPVSIIKILGFDAISLFKNPSYAVFALCSFLICIPLAFYYARTGDFVKLMAFGDDTGGVMALGQVSEIFFMALVPFFLVRLGVKKMLLVGMLAWAVRYVLFGMFPSSSAMLVLGIALHGICYDFFFVTGQLYTDRVAPPETRTSAQALVGLLTYGAGMLVGNYVLGYWGDSVVKLDPTSQEGWQAGALQFWLMPAIFAAAVAALFFFTFWDKTKAIEEDAVDSMDAGDAAPAVP